MGDFINASICEVCWNEKYPERKAPEKYGDHLVCHFCGGIHGSGIYIRQKSADRLQRDLATMTVRAETAERERDEARAEVEQSAELERERILRHVHRSLLNMSKAACRKDATPDEMRAYRTVALMVDSLTEQIDRLDHHRDGGG